MNQATAQIMDNTLQSKPSREGVQPTHFAELPISGQIGQASEIEKVPPSSVCERGGFFDQRVIFRACLAGYAS